MGYLLTFFLLGVLVFVHELGHLLAAKACGIPVARFSVGFGRSLWAIQVGATEYRVSLLPFGGYVLPALDAEAFQELPWPRQILFALGGPLANLVTAVATLVLYYQSAAGFSVVEALRYALAQSGSLLIAMIYALPTLLRQPAELTGIVGIVALGGAQSGVNSTQLLELFILISFNLALFNLLPLLPLDGGRIVMALLEQCYRPFRRLQTPLALTGWVLLLGLMLYVTALDLTRLMAAVAT